MEHLSLFRGAKPVRIYIHSFKGTSTGPIHSNPEHSHFSTSHVSVGAGKLIVDRDVRAGCRIRKGARDGWSAAVAEGGPRDESLKALPDLTDTVRVETLVRRTLLTALFDLHYSSRLVIGI